MEDGGSAFAVFEALVDLFADVFWEACDFAGAGVHKKLRLVHSFQFSVFSLENVES